MVANPCCSIRNSVEAQAFCPSLSAISDEDTTASIRRNLTLGSFQYSTWMVTLPGLALDRKSRALAKMWRQLLIIRSWCGTRVWFLLFSLAGRRGLRRHRQEYHASPHFFGELAGASFQFEADPVRRTVARRICQSAVHLEQGGRWHSRSGQQTDTEHRQAADGYRTEGHRQKIGAEARNSCSDASLPKRIRRSAV